MIIARSRLAQNVGLVLRAYYDLNPVGTGHWTNRLFIQHRDPLSLRSIDDPSICAHAFINPEDNADNLPKETLDELRALPSGHYARFYVGVVGGEAVAEGQREKHAKWRAALSLRIKQAGEEHRFRRQDDVGHLTFYDYAADGTAAGCKKLTPQSYGILHHHTA